MSESKIMVLIFRGWSCGDGEVVVQKFNLTNWRNKRVGFVEEERKLVVVMAVWQKDTVAGKFHKK